MKLRDVTELTTKSRSLPRAPSYLHPRFFFVCSDRVVVAALGEGVILILQYEQIFTECQPCQYYRLLVAECCCALVDTVRRVRYVKAEMNRAI